MSRYNVAVLFLAFPERMARPKFQSSLTLQKQCALQHMSKRTPNPLTGCKLDSIAAPSTDWTHTSNFGIYAEDCIPQLGYL